MPARILRETLLGSDRWLGLPHPVERLAFVVLLLEADDLGTLEASDGQLVRMWRDPCNVKGRDDALQILRALHDADLVRPYDGDDGKRYLFIPRFRQRFRAKSILRPLPPAELLRDEPEVTRNINEIKKHLGETTGTGPARDGRMPDACQARAPVFEDGCVVGENTPSQEGNGGVLEERRAGP